MRPVRGHGIGLRRDHFDTLFEHLERFDFLEVLSENFMAFGGKPREILDRVLEQIPVVLHGVGMNIGGPEWPNRDYLAHLETLIERTQTPWFSDHLSYSGAHGASYHDLIPLPFTDEAVTRVAERSAWLQKWAGRPFLLENPSYYIRYAQNEMDELTFINATLEAADCGLLLDVNNVFVNAHNHGYDAEAFIDGLPLERVRQIHMAGHQVLPDVRIDTHGEAPLPEVVALYRYTMDRIRQRHADPDGVATLLEWDHDIPDIETMVSWNDRLREALR